MKVKRTAEKEEDYFIPVLAPYVQWVRAYSQLISVLYEEHKTVRKAWKAFRKAIPGVERRLEFGVFEQILLFSLFLSEWNNSEERDISGEIGRQAEWRGAANRGKSPEGQLDTVIQKLQETIAERDRALWSLKHLEQDALSIRDQKAYWERQAVSFEKNLELLQNDFDAANERLKQVTQELDSVRSENADLREENAALRTKEASLEQQIVDLRKSQARLAADMAQTPRISAVMKPDVQEAFAQAVIQWSREASGQKVTQKSERKTPKKIGRWSAQRSREGYYRLYRKIGGRVHSIYIGKDLDIDKAEKRIADKERQLLSPGPAQGRTENISGKGQIEMKPPHRTVDALGDDN